MDISYKLRTAIENQITKYNSKALVKDARNISLKYREESGHGKKLLTTKSEAIAYSLARMPATYGAVSDALRYTLNLVEYVPRTMIDAGAGTGTATWAVDEQINLQSSICLEREDVMRSLGKSIMNEDEELSKKTTWEKHDLNTDRIGKGAELVIASYVLNEMTEDNRLKAVEKLWDATEKIMILIGPGTPKSYNNFMMIRKQMLEAGVKIIAPCPRQNGCPIKEIENEWCHFTCRINRSKIHRQLKGGDMPYEDEKYFYLAFAREDVKYKNINARILRHPLFRKGYVELEVCSDDEVKKITITKKDKERYKKARKSKTGDDI